MESNYSQQPSNYITAESSSGSRNRKKYSSFQSQLTTDAGTDSPSANQSKNVSAQSSRGNRKSGKENIKLVPIKVKDLIEMFQANPEYMQKSPVMINLKENDIDHLFEKKHHKNNFASASPQQSMRQSIRLSSLTLQRSIDKSYNKPRELFEGDTSYYDKTSRSDQQIFHKASKLGAPPLGENQAQVYAMTGIQAYPMIGANDGGFRANRSRKKTPRSKSRRKVAKDMKKRKWNFFSRSRTPRSRSRSRFRARPKRSKRRRTPKARQIVARRSRPRHRSRVVVRRKRRPVVIRRRWVSPYCTPYPTCDDFGPCKHPGSGCGCTLCQDKLQFIQPGVCSQRKDIWTNEYAIIPKPQVNLIDPCKELDPLIYPRADRPCIRDGRGNPLTDCIGRPLRDPIGKKFLNFSANGSVMDTNFRGNFYTGQPPLCVKCPLPGSSCAPDATHNWWMSCGYPVRANMGPFFNNVVAAENLRRRY